MTQLVSMVVAYYPATSWAKDPAALTKRFQVPMLVLAAERDQNCCLIDSLRAMDAAAKERGSSNSSCIRKRITVSTYKAVISLRRRQRCMASHNRDAPHAPSAAIGSSRRAEEVNVMSKINLLRSKWLPLAASLMLAAAASPAWCEEKIVLDGSSGMLPLARVLTTAYQERASTPKVEIGKGLGTGARLAALAENKIQIALASHGIKPEDVKKGNLKVIEVAKGAIVFAVNASVPITDITEAQVCDIYSGKVQNWQSLGGPTGVIVVLTRPPAEVDPEVIRAKIGCFAALKETETARVMARGGDMANGLADTPNAIGMTSMTVVEQSKGKVKALTINGVAPSAENVKNGRYFLTRDFLFVTKGEPTADIKKFLDFVLSPDGDRVILANGAVPLR